MVEASVKLCVSKSSWALLLSWLEPALHVAVRLEKVLAAQVLPSPGRRCCDCEGSQVSPLSQGWDWTYELKPGTLRQRAKAAFVLDITGSTLRGGLIGPYLYSA